MASLRPSEPNLPADSNGRELWFRERAEIGRHSSLNLEIEAVIARFKSYFQEIAVLQTRGFGRMLVLDGIIQTTEFDEAGYHEMICHVPLLVHPEPKRVLVIGGGDGGAVREALRHGTVEEVVLCEIDPAVVKVCQEHLPGLAQGLSDPRVEIVHADGAEYAASHGDSFDVIIVDSSDPVGPAKVLFGRSFYEALSNALRAQGVAVCQAESFFFHPRTIAGLFEFIPALFPVAAYFYTQVPSYPSGLIGFTFCSKAPHPILDLDEERFSALTGLRHYSPAIHRAAFALPPRALNLLPPKTRDFQAGLGV